MLSGGGNFCAYCVQRKRPLRTRNRARAIEERHMIEVFFWPTPNGKK